MHQPLYVLITAARNEERFIDALIESIRAQTILPQRWVIVSDGSTDKTDERVMDRAAEVDFIQLLRLDRRGERNFGSKAHAINAGYECLQKITHKFVGILDADVSLEPTYYASMMDKFAQHPNVGVAGGMILDNYHGTYRPQQLSEQWSVGGPIQMFRRECFAAVGGYHPMVSGGVDAVAEVMARMHGWQVRTFPDVQVMHHRQTGTASHGLGRACFRRGIQDYRLGYHPLFMLLRCLYRIFERPPLGGSAVTLSGYCWAALRQTPRQVPPPFVRFLRREQLSRLFEINVGNESKQ